MADGTKIEWTEATWNPITGCSVISAGCKLCYAMKLAGTRMQHHHSREGLTVATKAGPVWTGTVRFNDIWLTQPIGWKRPRDIFVNAHGDTFHEAVPDEWIDRLFAVMLLAPQHRFQVLTKRSARMREYMTRFEHRLGDFGKALAHTVKAAGMDKQVGLDLIDNMVWPPLNVWLGVSVEDQENAHRLDDLRETPAEVRWVSAEPLLGPLDLKPWLDALDWVVVGGESDKGPRARPMHPEWPRRIIRDCEAAGVPVLFKQWGDWHPSYGAGYEPTHWLDQWGRLYDLGDPAATGAGMRRIGKVAAGREFDCRTHDGMPQ